MGCDLKHDDGRIATQEVLENLWRAVVMQDTGERRATFMVNWLRGTIKIPHDVELRIYNKVKAYRKDIKELEI